MSRRADPDRKPQLLAEIIEYLLDKPLSALTFRTLAEYLTVSTFTLVYHFGTKDELLAEVVDAICDQQQQALRDAQINTTSVDEFFDSLLHYWEWMRHPRNRQLKRLSMEASMIESLSGSSDSATRKALEGWHEIALGGLLRLGVAPEIAHAEARALTSVVCGFQFDLIVLGDTEEGRAAFVRALDANRLRMTELVLADQRELDAAP